MTSLAHAANAVVTELDCMNKADDTARENLYLLIHELATALRRLENH